MLKRGSLMEQLLKKALLIGMGAAVLTREKIENFLNELSKAPEKVTIEELLSQLIKKGEETRNELEQRIGEKVKEIIKQTSLVTKEDILKLERKIEELEKKITDKS